jgi:TonB family protein
MVDTLYAINMKTKLIIMLLALYVLLSHTILGQESQDNTSSNKVIIEAQPYPKDGYEAFYKHFNQHMQYPKSALKDKIGGQVIISFVIDTTGKIVDYKIKEGVREDIDQEALRLMSTAPDWVPGYYKGRKVRVRMSMPLNFIANNKVRRANLKSKSNQ